MRIPGMHGVALTLAALRWQFPPDAGEWDDAWLIISGHVEEGDGAWSFTDPCLLVGEARELADWLRDCGEGRIQPDPGPMLSFTEPTLGFSVQHRDEHEVHLRFLFTGKSVPPRPGEHGSRDANYAVSLTVRPDRLLAAAEDWSRELDALPARPWVDPGRSAQKP